MTNKVLQVKHLDKYFGKHQVLTDINFDCAQGTITGLVGANGAGKTTIMKSILGMIKHTGAITINGKATSFTKHQALREVGALIEYPGIYPFLTGREHLKLFATGANAKANIDEVIDRLKLTSYIDRKARKYSLGMKQKLGIALALVNRPRVLILDEPMNGLDPQATQELRKIILEEKDNGVAVLISSHILSELEKVAEDLIIIDHGKVVQTSTMDQLLNANDHYLILSTDDDGRAVTLLNEKGFDVVAKKPIRIQVPANFNTEALIKLCIENQLAITDIRHENSDLEASILKIISENN